MFLDKAKIKIISGAGGNGITAWRREKYADKGGPAGGNGGRGGNIYLTASSELSTLLDFKFQSVFKAENGENGYIKTQHGKGGKDLYIKVPLGTLVKDCASDKIIADLNKEGQTILAAQGGRGGRGNACFASAERRAPQFSEPGESGIERTLELELKLIADIGLLGMPNAGKSTFISRVSSAKPKIADYPFTTLAPNLGVVKKDTGDGFVIADIPGLIEGASAGAGLGHEFLRHVERCRFLIHLVDLTQENPVQNYKIINEELKKHSERLSKVYQITALNKIDAVPEEIRQNYFKEFKKLTDDVFLISAVSGENIKEFMNFVSEKTDEIPKPVIEAEIEEDEGARNNDDSDYSVYKSDKHTFTVEGGKIFRLANVTDARNTQQLYRFQNILKAMGVFEALEASGIKAGDTVKIGHLEFEYYRSGF